jgi:hypothetical protein
MILPRSDTLVVVDYTDGPTMEHTIINSKVVVHDSLVSLIIG